MSAAVHQPLTEIFVLGPTASRKDRSAALLAVELRQHGVAIEIVGMDSIKVYEGLPILTDAPDEHERALAPHHLYGVVPPQEAYSVGRYRDDAEAAAGEIRARGHVPCFVGGTTLYFRALVDGLFDGPPETTEVRARLEGEFQADPRAVRARLEEVDPAAAERIHPNDERRTVRALEVYEVTGRSITEQAEEWRKPVPPPPGRRILGLMPDWEELRERIATRSRVILSGGKGGAAVAEVVAARERGALSRPALAGVGIRECLALADGTMTESEAEAELIRRTRRLAKSQRTWFRSLTGVEWIRLPRGTIPTEICERLLDRLQEPPTTVAPDF